LLLFYNNKSANNFFPSSTGQHKPNVQQKPNYIKKSKDQQEFETAKTKKAETYLSDFQPG